VSARERAYIEALTLRYAADPPADRADLDLAYAQAMRRLHRADLDDVDAATLLAEALMNLYPWDYWTPDGQPREYTPEIVSLLESALERQPTHVGANHYYIHAVEEFFPERAVSAADRLGNLAPDAGHLVHMPSHIYWRVGRYDDALEINRRAVAADESFFAWCRAGAFYRAAYYPHNVHFLWAAASAEGRSEIALSSARKLAASVADKADAFPFVEEFLAIPSFTLARFGRWDALLGEPPPAPRYRYLTGVWHYTRGLARVRTGGLQQAEGELARLRAVADEAAMRELTLAGGVATASELLAIGIGHLEGELAAAEADTDRAVRALERSVTLQDRLAYMEPPPWYFPMRQALGAVLLDAGRAAEAEAVYRLDLEQYPSNGWSLWGLSESLRRQGRDADSAWAERGFQSAWARADVELAASRF
jgi:tetratricopeptide (TPR) repeat protein